MIVISFEDEAMPYAPKHKRDTREKILESARRLFNRNGYSGVSIEEIMSDAGLTHGAASLLESSGDRFARSASVTNAKRLVYLKLMGKHQNTDPFKFIIYSAKIGEQTSQMASPK